MNKALTTTLCFSISLLTVFACRCLNAVRDLTEAQKGAATRAIHQEAQETREWLSRELVPILSDLGANANRQATGLRLDAKQEMKLTRAAVLDVAGEGLVRLDAAIAEVRGIRSDMAPVLAGATQTLGSVHETVDALHKTVLDLHPQALGLVAAAKVTAGETAQTMKAFRDAAPAFLSSVQDVATHLDAASLASAQASEHTAQLTKNLADATKPLPRAFRIGLQIGGPLTQIASYLVLMLSTLGML